MGLEVRALEYSPDLVQDLVLFVTEESFATQEWPAEEVKSVCAAQDFCGKAGELAFSSSPRVIVCGLGKAAELTLEGFRRGLGKVLKLAEQLKIENLTVLPGSFEQFGRKDVARALTEAALLADYRFERYLSEKKPRRVRSVQLAYASPDEAEVIEGLNVGQTLGEATNFARDLVNEPANTLTPERLAQRAEEAGRTFGFTVEVLEQEAIRELGMTAYLEVAKASVNTPRLIILRHLGNPDQPEQILGLVGKGLTFDSGGLSLKPAEGMGDMKFDMGGAAAVLGAMGAIARQKLPVNVVAVVAACENLVSGRGYRPGDIIGSRAGKTILIDSTDAEGRLTLADAVHYMVTVEKAQKVVDVATLTGAAIVALGHTTTGVLTNDQQLFARLESASEQSGERVWQLPAFPEYREQNKTPFADLKNTGGRPAGTITAGLFIEAFVEDTPWLHLDIAGTAFSSKDQDYLVQGGTGVAVRLLYHFAENL